MSDCTIANARHGPLKLTIWATAVADRFVITGYDVFLKRNVFRKTVEGTSDDAKIEAVKAAIRRNGQSHDVTWMDVKR
jgi:hypothetical protein